MASYILNNRNYLIATVAKPNKIASENEVRLRYPGFIPHAGHLSSPKGSPTGVGSMGPQPIR